MEIRVLTPDLSVSAQIRIADLAAIKAAGYRSIVCNRPDGEDVGQISFDDIDQAAKALGFETCFLPAESGNVSDEDGRLFGEAISALTKPVFAYCRSGMRCTTMWALSQAGAADPASIIEKARAAGYDLSGFASRIASHR